MAETRYETDPDALLAALVAKNEGAWRHLMERHGSVVVAVVRRFSLSEADGEEVFQNTFLSAFRAIRSLRAATRLDAWLYSIAYRAALDVIARRRPEQRVEEVHEAFLADEGERADEAIARLDDASRIRDVVAALDAKCRLLIEALYLADPARSYKDISESAGLPMGSIGPMKARCLDKLRKRLAAVSSEAGSESIQSTSPAKPKRPVPDERGMKK